MKSLCCRGVRQQVDELTKKQTRDGMRHEAVGRPVRQCESATVPFGEDGKLKGKVQSSMINGRANDRYRHKLI